MSQVPPNPSDPFGQPTTSGSATPPQTSYGSPGTPPAPYGQPGAPQQGASPFGSAPAAQNRTILGIVAILLGWLGVHKFMMGMTTPGIIMLLVSVVGGIVTCGAAAGVMSLIGLVEGIIYLTKTDEQFHQEYVVGKKQWF